MSDGARTQDDEGPDEGPEEGEIEDDDDETSLSVCESTKVREESSSSSSLDRDIRNHVLQRAIRKKQAEEIARSTRSLVVSVDNERNPSRAIYDKRDRARSRTNHSESGRHKTSRPGLTHGKENRHIHHSVDGAISDSHSKVSPLHHGGRPRSISPARRPQCREHREAHYSTSKRHRSLSGNASSRSSEGTDRELALENPKKKRNHRRGRRRNKGSSVDRENTPKKHKSTHDAGRRGTDEARTATANVAEATTEENSLKQKLLRMGALGSQTLLDKGIADTVCDLSVAEKSQSPLPAVVGEDSTESIILPEKSVRKGGYGNDADNAVIFVAVVAKPMPELVTLTDSDTEQDTNQEKEAETFDLSKEECNMEMTVLHIAKGATDMEMSVLDVIKGAADMEMSVSPASSNMEVDPGDIESVNGNSTSNNKSSQSSAALADPDDEDIIRLRQAALLSKNKSTTESAASADPEEDDLQLRVLALRSAVMRKAMDRKKRRLLAGASRVEGDEVVPVDMELADTDDEEDEPPAQDPVVLPPPPMPSQFLLRAMSQDPFNPLAEERARPDNPLDFQHSPCASGLEYPVIHPVHPVPFPGMPPEYSVAMEYPVVGVEYQSQLPDSAYREAAVPVAFPDTVSAPFQEGPLEYSEPAIVAQEEYLPEEWCPDEPESQNPRPNLRKIAISGLPDLAKAPTPEEIETSPTTVTPALPSPSVSTPSPQNKQSVVDEDEISLREKLLKAMSSKRESKAQLKPPQPPAPVPTVPVAAPPPPPARPKPVQAYPKAAAPVQPRQPAQQATRKADRPKSKALPSVPRFIIHLGEDSDSSDGLGDAVADDTVPQKKGPWQQTNMYQMKDYCPRTGVAEGADSSAAKESAAVANSYTEIMPDFESKLDRFLKDVRSSQEAATPSAPVAASVPVVSAPVAPVAPVVPVPAVVAAAPESPTASQAPVSERMLATPLVVRHLPASKQEEYRKLKQMIAERELKKKTQKLAATTKKPQPLPTETGLPRPPPKKATAVAQPANRASAEPNETPPKTGRPTSRTALSEHSELTPKSPTALTPCPNPPHPAGIPTGIPPRPDAPLVDTSASAAAPQVRKALLPTPADFFRGTPVMYAHGSPKAVQNRLSTPAVAVSAAKASKESAPVRPVPVQASAAEQLDQVETNLLKERSMVMGQIMALTRLQTEAEVAMKAQEAVEDTLQRLTDHLQLVCEKWSESTEKVNALVASVRRKRFTMRENYARTNAFNRACRSLGYQVKGPAYTLPAGNVMQSKQKAANLQFSRIIRNRKIEHKRARTLLFKTESCVNIVRKALLPPYVANTPAPAAVASVTVPPKPISLKPAEPQVPNPRPPIAKPVTKPPEKRQPEAEPEGPKGNAKVAKTEAAPAREETRAESPETKKSPTLCCARRLIRAAKKRLRGGGRPKVVSEGPKKGRPPEILPKPILGADGDKALSRSKRQLTSYKSPLDHLGTSRTAEVAFDPEAILCPYELNGKCEDEECRYQHQAKDLGTHS